MSRIALVSSDIDPAGIVDHVALLRAAGHDVEHVVPREPHAPPFEGHTSLPDGTLTLAHALLCERDYDVVIAFDAGAADTVAILTAHRRPHGPRAPQAARGAPEPAEPLIRMIVRHARRAARRIQARLATARDPASYDFDLCFFGASNARTESFLAPLKLRYRTLHVARCPEPEVLTFMRRARLVVGLPEVAPLGALPAIARRAGRPLIVARSPSELLARAQSLIEERA